MKEIHTNGINEIIVLIRELEGQLAELLEEDPRDGWLQPLDSAVEGIERAVRSQIDQKVTHAFLRVNLRDERYRFIRAIDGDTVVLQPPDEFLEWMKDIHLRLYGIETPGSNEEYGPAFTRIVEDLCTEFADRRVYVVWELERPNTDYPLFLRASFERGVGNLFLPAGDHLLYLNALLAMLPHVRTVRGDRSLIRGSRHLARPAEVTEWHGGCATQLPGRIVEVIASHLTFDHGSLPVCLCIFPRSILKIVEESPSQGWALIRDAIIGRRCPVSTKLDAGINQDFAQLIDDRVVSPFDLPLVLAANWRSTSSP